MASVIQWSEGKTTTDRVHEVACCREEESVATLWSTAFPCRKNPGHAEYIPVSEFGQGHLPGRCRDSRLVKYILMRSRFVVKVVSRRTSAERPKTYGKLKTSRDVSRFATGFVSLPESVQEMKCPILNCPHNRGRAHNVHGYIRVSTNKHVVYDDLEASRTSVQFFFDSPYGALGLPTAQCIGLDFTDTTSDLAKLICVTHDLSLYERLRLEKEDVQRTYCSIPMDLWRTCENLTIAISHPHGKAKTISVGSHQGLTATKASSHAHYYTSATCPGSSGAPVFYLSKSEQNAQPMWVPAIHSYYCLRTKYNVGFK